MAATGLLILTSPLPILQKTFPDILKAAETLVKGILYVHLQPSAKLCGTQQFVRTVPFTFDIMRTLFGLYQAGSFMSSPLDLRVLLGHLTGQNKKLPGYYSHRQYDIILHDLSLPESDVAKILKDMTTFFQKSRSPDKKLVDFLNISPIVEQLQSRDQSLMSSERDDTLKVNGSTVLKSYDHLVIGGTFDFLHVGHKILLSQACLLADKSFTIGVCDGPLITKKDLWELIAPLEQRISFVKEFVEDVKPNLHYNIVPITDVYGPTIVDPHLDCLVVSQETIKGGQMINAERVKRGLKPMVVEIVDLVQESYHIGEEAKVSSSNRRHQLLGTLLHTPKPRPHLLHQPFRIGLTGGIASGKSSISKWLQDLGASIVDCDKLGHQVYLKGTVAFQKIIETFGQDVVGDDGEVNRKTLGRLTFNDQDSLEKLNCIVWPEIAKIAEEKISEFAQEKKKVVVLEAAVLLEAGWDEMVHEIWLSMIPEAEAVKRLMVRNKVSEDEAKKRLQSQWCNKKKIARSNVVLSSLWEYEVTRQQVEKAWTLLKGRLET